MNGANRECACILKQEDYENYFRNQSGGRMDVFSGPARQRGYGIGSILSKGLSMAAPILKEGVKNMGKHLFSAGANAIGNIAEDVIRGENIKSSAKSQFKKTGQELANEALSYFAPKPNKTRSRKRKLATSSKAAKQRRVQKDIFG
jgi:hypothetical protein